MSADEHRRMMDKIHRDNAKADMKKRGGVYGNPAAIQDGIADVVKMLGHTARMVTTRPSWNDLTPEGKTKEWERQTATHKARLNRLDVAGMDLVIAADSRLQKAWDKLQPEAKGSQEVQTAEMYVARVLGRGKMDHLQLDKITKGEPSPGRTLLLEEIVARGWFTEDQVGKFLAGSNEEYVNVSREVAQIKGDVNAVLSMQLRFARERLESVHAALRSEQRYEGTLNVRTEGVGDSALELELWDFPDRRIHEKH